MPKKEQTERAGAHKYVTQKDVAERAGVSPSIVSYVINNGPRSISEATRQRVLHAIAELEYRPNIHAQQLMRAKWESELAPDQYGILVGGPRKIIQRIYYPNLLYGILEEATHHNYHLRFLQFFEDMYSPVVFNKLFHPEEVSAVIMVTPGPMMLTEEGQARLEHIRARVPNLVSIGRALPNIPSIIIDLPNVACQATAYLLSLGHRRVAYVGGPNLRLEGYQQALQESNLPFDPALFFNVGIDYLPSDGYKGGQMLLESGLLGGANPVTAIMAGNDEVAMGVIRRLHESGLHIPRDLSIIGMDNHELSACFTPALTTVQLPQQEMGQLAVQIIMQRVGHTADPAPLITLPTQLIIRESCAPIS